MSELGEILATAQKGFAGLVIQEKGRIRGGTVYGDDVVHTVIITGWSYKYLIRRSLEQIVHMQPQVVLQRDPSLGERQILIAQKELVDSFTLTLQGRNSATTDHVYEPLRERIGDALMVVPGCRVYRCAADLVPTCHCRGCTKDPRAPLDGTIYLQGLRVWSRILTPSQNGPIPSSHHSSITKAKIIFRSLLPVGRYVSYALEPGKIWMLKIGGGVVETCASDVDTVDEVRMIIRKAG